ncbi:MAG TPA: zf-HC2 domain-containing protein, partial [Gemmatimonadaceae bacterium]|nr:zf-HC2 domain-containing protein [Gemmatimonadaceae bacterium]
MQHLDEGTIHAWLDGALSPEEAARAEAHVESCSMCAAATAEARGLIAASSRILTALDNVPRVKVSPGTVNRRRYLTTWLVREKLAAVLTLVVAGGALALVMSRDTQRAAEADLASEPIRTFEIAVADSSASPPVVAPEASANQESTDPRAKVQVTSPLTLPRGVAGGRSATPPPALSIEEQPPTVIAEAAPVSGARTDDSLRSLAVAQLERQEARDASAEATSSLAGKIGAGAVRRRAQEAQASYAETRPPPPVVGTAAGAPAREEAPRLVQEEKMVESGDEVRRRIYSVDGILVTLDERFPGPFERRRAAANADLRDTTAVTTTIRWTDASGKEFTLTGPASAER